MWVDYEMDIFFMMAFRHTSLYYVGQALSNMWLYFVNKPHKNTTRNCPYL